MIKCEECGAEFSYGRKINCCKSVHFGKIFSSKMNEHRWNCNPGLINYKSVDIHIEKIFEMVVVDDDVPIQYDMELKGYVILYE